MKKEDNVSSIEKKSFHLYIQRFKVRKDYLYQVVRCLYFQGAEVHGRQGE